MKKERLRLRTNVRAGGWTATTSAGWMVTAMSRVCDALGGLDSAGQTIDPSGGGSVHTYSCQLPGDFMS